MNSSLEKIRVSPEVHNNFTKVLLSIFCAMTITSCGAPLTYSSENEVITSPKPTESSVFAKQLETQFGYLKGQVEVETSFLDSRIKKVETIKPLTVENTPNTKLLTYGDKVFADTFNSQYDKKNLELLVQGVETYYLDIKKLSQENEGVINDFLNGVSEPGENLYLKSELNRLIKNLKTPDFRNKLPHLSSWSAKDILREFVDYTEYKLNSINNISRLGFKETTVRVFPNDKYITECTNASMDFFQPLTTVEEQLDCSNKTSFFGFQSTYAYDKNTGKNSFASGFVHTILVAPFPVKYPTMSNSDYNYSLGMNYAYIYSHEDWHARFAQVNNDLERTFIKGSEKYKIMQSIQFSGDGEHVIMYSIQSTQRAMSSYRNTSNILFPDTTLSATKYYSSSIENNLQFVQDLHGKLKNDQGWTSIIQ